ncbi:MAG: phosphoenolpyruvate--protein phosphotransferase [Spirochaetaceae bacterium]|jgi:phosphotransferase system enzyme I (PtsI)|nr:phosphoenolpyruvate--protein phosphotransferase [Spirochaetaceae bacterium]
MKTIVGIPASPGIVIGTAFRYAENANNDILHYIIPKNQVGSEWLRFLRAQAEAVGEVRNLYAQLSAEEQSGKEQADILNAHLMMLEDPDFHDQIKAYLQENLQNIEWVIQNICLIMKERLAASQNALLQERAADIDDVCNRLIYKLLNVKRASLKDLDRDAILVCADLLPSDVLTMHRDRVKGIVMEEGSRTSHTAILIRAFAIPAVLGLSAELRTVKNGDELAVNGDSGEVIINPDNRVLKNYRGVIAQYRKNFSRLQGLRELPAETKDGYRVILKANIEIPQEAVQADQYGADGIGLYRSEFLFLTSGQFTGEEEQYQAYTEVLKAMGNLPVTIRTLDIGGDKLLPELMDENEKNPLLGWRAIRFSLSRPDLFKTQLRALLRAGVHGNLRIMFPMISGIEELEQALALLEEAKTECRRKGQAYSDALPVGTMIEIPSAAMTADILAERSNFFSIGTNDLVQYTLAADRGNEKVGYLAQPSHPAIIRLLKQIVDQAHQKGITAALCGELAGDPSSAALLLGLGVDEFSMTANCIPKVKQIIRKADLSGCRTLAQEALHCTSYRQVTRLRENWMSCHFPEADKD